MKFISMSLIGLLAATTAALAQTTVISEPSGYTTLNLPAGASTFVGLNLVPPTAYAGTFDVVAADTTRRTITLTAAGTGLTNNQFNTVPHFIEITTPGPRQGMNTVITGTFASGSSIVLQDALPADIVSGGTVTIRRLWTLSTVFGATNQAGLTGGISSNSADLIRVPNSAAGYDQYFYSTGGFTGIGWRQIGAGTANKASVPLYFTDGFYIFNRGATKSVTLPGTIKTGPTQVLIETGNNYLANLCPVQSNITNQGRTLGNSGLYNGTTNGLTGATSAENADLVLVPNGAGYIQYFYSTGGFTGVGWRKIGAGSTDQSSTPLAEGCFIVYRKGAPVMVQLTQGSF
ncbi:MAG: TIGR02597 family protein [Prosthecobacter sp.]|uniref:TIGR02597 family protein n=1 Tax=Prosthecobacter sp. TaxID=1965333 RepID=UPI0038FD72C6